MDRYLDLHRLRSSPAESSTQNISWSMPVLASAWLSEGPSVWPCTSLTSETASGAVSQHEQDPRLKRPEQPGHRRQQVGEDEHRRVHAAGPLAAEADRERPLARAAVGVDVADVVDDQDRRGEQPDRDRQRERLPAQVRHLDEERAGDRDNAEEQEHEHLAQSLVAVGSRAAGVEHAGEDRGGADQQQLPAGDDDQVDARQHRQAEADVGRDEHLAGRDQPAGGDPHRPEPILGVGAATGVGVVVAAGWCRPG